MNIVVFTPLSPKVSPIRGILLQKQGLLLEVAWDSTPERPSAIGWVRLCKQISFKDAGKISWTDRAIKAISSGDIPSGREMIFKANKARQLERLRKEGAL
jgi:hypothetical protein